MPDTTLSATMGERLDDETKSRLRKSAAPRSTAPEPRNRVLGMIERGASHWGTRTLAKLAANRGSIAQSLQDVPQRMHIVANQTQLVLELIDDFKTGTYREIPWRHVAVLSAATLYAVSPADVIPDFLPLVGSLDDLMVVAIATRLARKQLKAYCEFKGYALEEYFGAGA